MSWELVACVAGFALVCLSSNSIGVSVTRAKLPLITGFLFTGIIAGPYVLELIPKQAVKGLRFVDHISLAVIAFAAGNELYLKELRDRLKSIGWISLAQTVVIFGMGAITLLLVADLIPFLQGVAIEGRVACALFAGTIMVARSPSSAIAIIQELRAKGPYSQTALGVTVVIDIVVIVLFSISSSVASGLLSPDGFDVMGILVLIATLIVSIIPAVALWKLFDFILSWHGFRTIKMVAIVALGYGVFVGCDTLAHWAHENLPFDLHMEPLLICMVGSFLVTNFTKRRQELSRLLHNIGPPVYVAFFTLTGASLEMDVVVLTWHVALVLFVVRLAGIWLGGWVGGSIAKEPKELTKISWMAYVTQAGVGLGLAKGVAGYYPDWGPAFATMIIALITLNQIIGPPIMKWAIGMAGEDRSRAEPDEFDEGQRDALIFGLQGQSIALARQLVSHGWTVKIASFVAEKPNKFPDLEIHVEPIEKIDLETMELLNASQAEAIVCMLTDDTNYQICELAYEHYGTRDLIVRLNDRRDIDRFHELDVLVVDPAAALVSIFDHCVRSPRATSILLGVEEGQDMIDIELRNEELVGLQIRDLRMPLDAAIVSVHREPHHIVAQPGTRLELGDMITVTGSDDSLEQLLVYFDA